MSAWIIAAVWIALCTAPLAFGVFGFHPAMVLPASDRAKIIAALIREHSEEWSTDGYYWTHPTGAAFRLGPGRSYVRIGTSGGCDADYAPPADRALIWRLGRRLEKGAICRRRAAANAAVLRETADFAKRVLDRYDRETVVPFERRA